MSGRAAVQSNVGQALAQRRLAEARRRLQALGEEYPLYEEGVDTGENIASDPPAPESPAGGSDETEAAPDLSTTVQNLDQGMPAGDFGDRERVLSSVKRQADDMSNSAVARPDDEANVEAPVANLTDERAQQSQYDESGWDANADNQPQGGGDSSDTSIVVPDGSGRAPMQTGAATKQEPVILKRASASQVYQLADLYTELGLVPHEKRYAAIAEMEKAPAMLVADRIKLLGRVKQVFATQIPQGRVARTAGAIPVLGRTASARTPSMARQAENKRLATSAEDTLLLL